MIFKRQQQILSRKEIPKREGYGGGSQNKIFALFDLLFKFKLVNLVKENCHDIKSCLQLFSLLEIKKGGGYVIVVET